MCLELHLLSYFVYASSQGSDETAQIHSMVYGSSMAQW